MHDIGNRPAQVALTITAGDYWRRTPTITGVDLTGCTLRGQIRKDCGGATVAEIDCSITDAGAGETLWEMQVPTGIGGCDARDPAAKYIGEVELVDSLGRPLTLVRMNVTIISEVARAA